ncbi:MAG: hypothetical protein LQ350_008460 [Teloschistes chrysophthalmus]|nr:MAG: hypothetical protein LQ350_008460 [Niorma chrysophthalma]
MPRDNQPMGMVLRDEDELAIQLQNEYYEAETERLEALIHEMQWGWKRWLTLFVISFFILAPAIHPKAPSFFPKTAGLSNDEILFEHYNRCKIFCQIGRWWAGPNVTYPVRVPPAYNWGGPEDGPRFRMGWAGPQIMLPTRLPTLPRLPPLASSLSSRLLPSATPTTTAAAAADLPTIFPEGLATMDRESLLAYLDQHGSSLRAFGEDHRRRRQQEDWDMPSDKEEEKEVNLNAHFPTGEDAYNTNHPNPHYGIHTPSNRPRHHHHQQQQQQHTQSRTRGSSDHLLPLVEEMDAPSNVAYAKAKAQTHFTAYDDFLFFNPPPPSTPPPSTRFNLDQDMATVEVVPTEWTFLEELLQGVLLLMGSVVAVVVLFGGGLAWYHGWENRAKDRRVAEEKARQMEEESMRRTGHYTTAMTTTTWGDYWLYNTLSGFSTRLLDLGATIVRHVIWWLTRCTGCLFVLRLCLFFTKEDYERDDNAIDVTISALVGFVVGCASVSVPVIVGLAIYFAAVRGGDGGVRHDDGVEKCHLPGCGQPVWEEDAPCPSIEGQGWCRDHWFHPDNTAANDHFAGLTTDNEIRTRWSQSQGTWVYDNGNGNNGKGHSRTASTQPTGHRFAPTPAHQAPPDPPTFSQWYSFVVGGEQVADAPHHNPDASFRQHLPSAPPRPPRPQYHESARNYDYHWGRENLSASSLRPGMGMRGIALSAEEDVRRFRSRVRSSTPGQRRFA